MSDKICIWIGDDQNLTNAIIVSRLNRAEVVRRLLMAFEGFADAHSNPTRPGRPGKAIEILEVDATEYAPWIAKGAQPLAPRAFDSAMEASEHLGYTHNAVGQALAGARNINQTEATLRGVRFRYVEDAPE